jgi:Brp/Blh family beta-carotene 15,15'-monooxygenase
MTIPSEYPSKTARPLDAWSAFHSATASVVAFVISLTTMNGMTLPRPAQAVMLAFVTGLIGIPHGGLDHRFGRAVFIPLVGPWWPLLFFGIYVLLSLIVLLGWMLYPLATIVLFFLLSAIHFSGGAPSFPNLVEGGMVIWVPFLLRPTESLQTLVDVTPQGLVGPIEQLAADCRPLIFAAALVLAARVVQLSVRWSRGAADAGFEVVRLIAFTIVFGAAPVLVSFGFFFCGWHSTRELAHLATLANENRPFQGLMRVIRHAAPLTAIFLILAALAALWQLAGRRLPEPTLVRTVFIGLSMVAMPHIVLHAIIGKLGVEPFARELSHVTL